MNQKNSLQNNTNSVSFLLKMKSQEEMARSIRLPKQLWSALDDDAFKCKRSSVKQLEAILSSYFGLDDVETVTTKIEAMKKKPLIVKGQDVTGWTETEILKLFHSSVSERQEIPILREGAGASDSKKK